jgi:aminopeptidase N
MIRKKAPGYFLVMFLAVCLYTKAQTSIPGIDVQHYDFSIHLSDDNDTIKGFATVQIKFLKDVKGFELNLVKQNSQGKGMLVSAVTEGRKSIAFSQDSDLVHINTSVNKNDVHSYTITYQGIPADGLIISKNEFGHRTFFGDNWPNRAHNWLPCADYPADKATVDFFVYAPNHYDVVANGLKMEEREVINNMKLTHWHESAELPTKVMVIGAADFAIDHTGDVGQISVYTYVFPESKEAGFKSYAVAKEILPFYIKTFGPFAYEKLANVQSKTIFGGMENASAIFYYEESVASKGIEELMAHEIAHQWFGDAASEKGFSHLWLSEGFATYMTNVYLEHKYGADTLKKRLIADRKRVFAFEKRRFTPVVDTTANGKYMQLLNDNSYQKGGWILHMLRRKLGDSLFWKGIRNYYAKYNGANANTDDLRLIMEQASGQDLKIFFKQWLYTPGHPKLNITWNYNKNKQTITLNIEQKQDVLFEFPLEISIAGVKHTVSVKKKNMNYSIAAKEKPTALTIDPDINLLFGCELTELAQ